MFEGQITRVEAVSILSFFPLVLYVNFTKIKKNARLIFVNLTFFLV